MATHNFDKIAGIDTSKVKSDSQYRSFLKYLESSFTKSGLDAVIPNQKVRNTVLTTLAYCWYKNEEDYKKIERDIQHEIHEMATANQLAVFQKYTNSVTAEAIKKDFRELKQTRERKSNERGLTKEEEIIFNRVKVFKDFGDGWVWVMAVDDDGKPVGYIPSQITNKTMGHCGNQPSKKDGDVYYELRHNNKPYLTVILDAKNKIKESKGPNNALPKEIELVSPYVKWFMTHEQVKGTSYEYGYARDRNFSVIKFMGHDPEFVKDVEKKHPHLINETVDRPIFEYKRRLQNGEITEQDVIESWEKSDFLDLSLEHLRGILGRVPFDESKLVEYIKRGRLTATEIGNCDHKLLTNKVQDALIENSWNNLPLLRIAATVPGHNIRKDIIENIIKYNAHYLNNFSEDTQMDLLDKYGAQFVEGLKEKPQAIQDVPKDILRGFLDKYGAQFAEGLKKDPSATIHIPYNMLKDFLDKYGAQFAEGLKEKPQAIQNVPTDILRDFLDKYGEQFAEGLKEDPTAIRHIPKDMLWNILDKYGAQFAEELKKTPMLLRYVPIDMRRFFNVEEGTFDREGFLRQHQQEPVSVRTAHVVLAYIKCRNRYGTTLENDLYAVGAHKPLGYMPMGELQDPAQVVSNLKSKGLSVIVLNQSESSVLGGAVVAYDANALGRLLKAKKKILDRNKWPSDPDGFVRYHMKHSAPIKTDLYDLIADAYGDFFTPYRKTLAP